MAGTIVFPFCTSGFIPIAAVTSEKKQCRQPYEYVATGGVNTGLKRGSNEVQMSPENGWARRWPIIQDMFINEQFPSTHLHLAPLPPRKIQLQ